LDPLVLSLFPPLRHWLAPRAAKCCVHCSKIRHTIHGSASIRSCRDMSSSVQEADVFSLGVLMHGMLTARKAWGGLSEFQISYAMLHEGRGLTLDAPDATGALALRCLSRDVATRPTAAALAEELWRLLDFPGPRPAEGGPRSGLGVTGSDGGPRPVDVLTGSLLHPFFSQRVPRDTSPWFLCKFCTREAELRSWISPSLSAPLRFCVSAHDGKGGTTKCPPRWMMYSFSNEFSMTSNQPLPE